MILAVLLLCKYCVCIRSVSGQEGTLSTLKEAEIVKRLNQSWETSVRPILAKNCMECHSAIEHSGKLDMESISSLFRGGLSGAAIDRESPSSSLLLQVLAPYAKKHMPPDDQLSEPEIKSISQWLEDFKQLGSIPDAWQTGRFQPTASNGQSVTTALNSDPIRQLPMGLNPTQVIDIAISTGWHINDVKPSALADDAVFARRLYLDLIGRIPLESELESFVNDTDSRKREHLVDSLLASDAHALHMAEVLNAVLMGRSPADRKGPKEKSGWMEFLSTAIRSNRPWNEVAREMILARPTRAEDRGAVWYLHSRQNKHQEIAEAVSKDFFGVRIDCAQCHDHPLASEIEQKHYWGLVAFFNRSSNADSADGPRMAESAIGGFSEFTNIGGKSAENKLVYLRAQPVEEPRPSKETKEEDRDDLYLPAANGELRIPKFSRRQHFVDRILTGNPLVAEAMVNRMWGWMFGRGIVHPVDAIDSFHPASHPGLLDWLSRDFEKSNYDVRRLLRYMALSRAYQLDSTVQIGSDPKWFSSGPTKPLTAESLYRSMGIALDVTDPAAWNTTAKINEFANLFPDVLTEESLANVTQGLWLTNSAAVREMASVKNSTIIQRAIGMEESDLLVEHLYHRILGRLPDDEERSHCVDFLSSRTDHLQTAIESLVWALITSAEFRFNH
ncbi:MAG: DUF1549 domain-containing protein [Pirellula sp.]